MSSAAARTLPPQPSREAACADEEASDLNNPVGLLRLPTRMANWAARNGIATIGQLVALRPERLLHEPNLGKLTVEQTARLIETRLGRPWESFASEEPPPDPRAPDAPVGWDDLREFVPLEALSTPLDRLMLPARVRSFAARRSIATIGELIAIPLDQIKAQRNLGRASIDAVRNVVMGVWGGDTTAANSVRQSDDHEAFTLPASQLGVWPAALGLDPIAPPSLVDTPCGFLEAWHRHLGALSNGHRQVLSSRAGLSGPPSTLAQLGTELGVSRARVQQMEQAALRRLRAQRAWVDSVERYLEIACPEGESVALDELEADPFWQGVSSKPEALRYLLEHTLGGSHHCFEFEGRFYVARRPGAEIEAAWESLYDELGSLPYPVELGAVETLVEARTSGLGRALGEAFRELVRGELHVDEGEGEARGSAFGSSRAQNIVALLRSSPTPVRVADLHARFGPGTLPDEALFLGWGLVGLERHVPDFRAWMDRVVPPTIALLREAGDPARQWSTSELIRGLGRQIELPPWLDHWHLASMLRVSGAVRYLGRLCVALDEGGGGRQRRLFIRDALEQVLSEAGEPLPQAEMVERARVRAAMSPAAVSMTLRVPPFVRLPDGRVGLAYRDQEAPRRSSAG
jgi:Sigma-70, region 4/Bacterial RNA polymerase, alpha chain C terminal domain